MQVAQNVSIELGLFLNSLVFRISIQSSEEPFCSRVAALPNAFCIHGRGIDDDDAGHEAAMGLGGRAWSDMQCEVAMEKRLASKVGCPF